MLEAIRLALGVESAAVRHNTQTFNTNRYRATGELGDYQALKDEARRIKEQAIEDLPHLLRVLEVAVQERGGRFYLASTAADACRYILSVCEGHGAELVVKGKSITSEEIRLNRSLEEAGIEVAETDLAEFILQVADEQPSHIVAPAIHYSRERITALFHERLGTTEPLETGESLTKFARERLREKFLRADIGITGANLIAAESGTLMLVESEGNIRMASLLPPVHIAIAGVEKVVPTRRDMGPFLELLARSGTGQRLTSYTTFVSPPLEEPSFAFYGKPMKPREFHLVLLDNGRLGMRTDPLLREALYCIRCSACLNSCANFQTVGGHAFGGETYSGGIGGAWEAGTGALQNARFADLCTGCSRCVPQCPVRIDVPWLNEVLRDRLNQVDERSVVGSLLGLLGSIEAHDSHASIPRIFFGNYHIFARWGARLAPFSNWLITQRLVRRAMEFGLGLDSRRALPPFARRTLVSAERGNAECVARVRGARAVLFADVYTNFSSPGRGQAVLKVLRAIGADVSLSKVMPDGRAPLSQGMIATARRHAKETAAALGRYVDRGVDIVVVEPSVLSLLQRDYAHLLQDRALFESLRDHTFEPVEYLARILAGSHLRPEDIFDVTRSLVGRRLFYHPHCQQRTIGADRATVALLREVGFEVETSRVECCGMAGSFGYKTQFYDLSMAVGADLFAQVSASENGSPHPALVASGTSCVEQLRAGMRRPVHHPMELLASLLPARS
jgi:iron-sulfur cluster protein